MRVVDSNVLAYVAFKEPRFREESLAVLMSDDQIVVPDFCIVELANVAWKWVRHHGLDPSSALAALDDALGFISYTIPAAHIWQPALELAIANDHAVYDMFFVVAARSRNTHLVTYDTRLLREFPDLARLPSAVL